MVSKEEFQQPTRNRFNRACLVVTLLLWLVFFILCYFLNIDWQNIPAIYRIVAGAQVLFTIIKFWNDYHYAGKRDGIKESSHFMHGLQAILPLYAIICLLLIVARPCKGEQAIPAWATRQLNDSETVFRKTIRTEGIKDYTAVIDSIKNYRRNTLQKILSTRNETSSCNLTQFTTLDSIPGDSLSLICGQLARARKISEDLNRLLLDPDPAKIKIFMDTYRISDSTRAPIRHPGYPSLEDRYSLHHYLLLVAQQVEHDGNIDIVLPPRFPGETCNIDHFEFIITKKLLL